jgi:hypothetical protein
LRKDREGLRRRRRQQTSKSETVQDLNIKLINNLLADMPVLVEPSNSQQLFKSGRRFQREIMDWLYTPKNASSFPIVAFSEQYASFAPAHLGLIDQHSAE